MAEFPLPSASSDRPGTILVIVEHRDGTIDDTTLELAGAARSLAGEEPGEVVAAILGSDVRGLAEELAGTFDEVVVVDHPRFAVPDGAAAAAVLEGLVGEVGPGVVLIPHTNVGMDLAPGLAARTGRPLLADCLSLEMADDRLTAVRTVYGGKIRVRAAAVINDGAMATVRPGAFDAGEGEVGGAGRIREVELPADPVPGRRAVETVAPDPGAVDLSQSEALVAVGRGIEDGENLELIESLAEALGAEIACTRPVVDKGWLPKSRQVGTSGVTVKPRVYVALGVSGSFQHMGGVKGDPWIAAVNVDPTAPIFAQADVGVVGDLFDIVPILEEKIREARR